MNWLEMVSLVVALVLLVATTVALVDLFYGAKIDLWIKRWMGRK